MKNRTIKGLSAVFLGALILGLPTGAGDGASDATVQSYEDQLSSIVTKQRQALNELAEIRNGQEEAQVEIGKYDELLRYNNEMKNLASGQLDSLTEQITQKKQSITDTTAALEAQEQAFLDRMVAVYMEEDTDWLELLLDAEDLTDCLVRMERVNAIFDYDEKIITSLKANRELLEADTAALEKAEETQMKRVTDYETAIQQSQALYEEKLEFMENLQKDEAKLVTDYSYYKGLENELNAELEEYLAERAREQERIRQEEERRRQEEEQRRREEEERRRQEEEQRRQEELAAQQQANTSDSWDTWGDSSYEEGDDFNWSEDEYTDDSYGDDWNSIHEQDTSNMQYTYTGGMLNWPLEEGVSYSVSSEYGWRTLYGVEDFHLAIDLACDNGTTVYAAAGGTVLRSEYHESYGNYVLIDHGNGLSTLYAHMSSCAVSVGETVSAGQTVGWVGLTGNTFGYHLHFETRENGSTVNPRNYIVLP